MSKQSNEGDRVIELARRWLSVQRQRDIHLSSPSQGDETGHLKSSLLLERECQARKAELMGWVMDYQSSQPSTQFKFFLPEDVRAQIEDDLPRFAQVRRDNDDLGFAGSVVLSWALWNDDDTAQPPSPSADSHKIVELWESLTLTFEVLQAHILRELRLVGVEGKFDVDLLPPLDVVDLDSEKGWPRGDIMDWTENDVFSRSPSNEGIWLRAGFIPLRIRAPDYPTFAHIEKLVLEHLSDAAEKLASTRCSLGLSADPMGGYLMAHYLRSELLAREVSSLSEDNGPISTTITIARESSGQPNLLSFNSRFTDGEGAHREIKGHCAVSDDEDVMRTLSPWIKSISEKHAIQVFHDKASASSSQSSGDPWRDATPPPRDRYH